MRGLLRPEVLPGQTSRPVSCPTSLQPQKMPLQQEALEKSLDHFPLGHAPE